jgi:hypothetical protein
VRFSRSQAKLAGWLRASLERGRRVSPSRALRTPGSVKGGEILGIVAIRVYLHAARRLPGVYTGAQARLSQRQYRGRDMCDFQDFRVLEPPRCTAVHRPVHDS